MSKEDFEVVYADFIAETIRDYGRDTMERLGITRSDIVEELYDEVLRRPEWYD